MGFEYLRFYRFRNLEDTTLSCKGSEVFLVGENGQGKTNILEGVYCLSYGSSFRTRKDENLIQYGEKEALVEGFYTSDDSSYKIRFHLTEEGKKIRLDGKDIRDRGELVGSVPCILFAPEDIRFIQGPPEMQRFFFNQTATLSNPFFLSIWKRYLRILKQRNAVLKAGNPNVLDVYDPEFIKTGMEITRERKILVASFLQTFSFLFKEVSQIDRDVSIRYVPSWNFEDPQEVQQVLQSKREADFTLGTTTTGPHRDRFRFFFGLKEFSSAASNGQIRLASLLLKSAQAHYVCEKTGRKPIFLVDDVLLEMDYPRRKRFLSHLPKYEQSFFTFLPDEPYTTYRTPSTRVYTVTQGVLKESGEIA